MKLFIPRYKYKAITLTGTWCALNCSFCNKRYLRGMLSVTPVTVEGVLVEMWRRGVKGALLSGGFRPDGTLPIEPYVEKLREVKGKTGLLFSAHLGLVRDPGLLESLKGVVDVVDYEFTQSEEIVVGVRGFPKSYLNAYRESLQLIVDSGLYVVPHVFAWYPGMNLESLEAELRFLEDVGVEAVSLLVYIPQGSGVAVPAGKVVEALRLARSAFPGELYLGCMRPLQVKKLVDSVAVEEGLVDRVANPYPTVLRGQESGLELYDACCSIPSESLEVFRALPLAS